VTFRRRQENYLLLKSQVLIKEQLALIGLYQKSQMLHNWAMTNPRRGQKTYNLETAIEIHSSAFQPNHIIY